MSKINDMVLHRLGNNQNYFYGMLIQDINNHFLSLSKTNNESLKVLYNRRKVFNHFNHIISFLERNNLLYENDITYLINKLYDFLLYQPDKTSK